MSHIEYWNLLSDILLFLALGYLSFQFVRSPRLNAASRQLRELEGALRSLIKEADGAGRGLNDQLLRRQQSLERLLIDAQLAEQRMEQGLQRTTTVESRNEQPGPQPSARSAPKPAHSAPEPGSFNDTRIQPDEREEESDISFGSVNIYGEPIAPQPPRKHEIPGRALRRALQTYTPLAAQIEKEVTQQKVQSARASVEDIYAAAEEMLRAGTDLAAVASQTRLPIEEVRALSQMIIGERAVKQGTPAPVEQQAEEADPRLGVMATMRRQTITL